MERIYLKKILNTEDGININGYIKMNSQCTFNLTTDCHGRRYIETDMDIECLSINDDIIDHEMTKKYDEASFFKKWFF